VIAKEIRALLPAWAAAGAALIACALVRDLYPFGIPAYFIGAATLGAMTFGHEYSYRTLPLMLTLPVTRRRVLLTKLVVLGSFLLFLAALAAWTLPFGREARVFRGTVLWLPFFATLFITPYLTTITRSPVGGAVFTLGIAGMLLVAGDWIGVAKYGDSREVDTFRVAFVWRAEIILCAASALLMWRTFTRLETLDGRGPVLDLAPRAAAASTSLTRRGVTRLLIGKELHLQQLAFAIAAIYVVSYFVMVIRARGRFNQPDVSFLFSMLYAWVTAVVIGAVASAEERHLRTVDAQLLLPITSSRQWWIKVSVVLGLTFVLAVVLPAVLETAFLPERGLWGRFYQWSVAVTILLALFAVATISLYVSTLCSSALWALLIAVPAAFAAATFLGKLSDVMERLVRWSSLSRPSSTLTGWTMALTTVAVIGIVLRLALENHRSADRTRSRIAGQVAIAAAAAVVAIGLIGVAGTVG
jgi:ABC-type transport system involved in multi-copper enzyme maturation permease subunit